MATCRDCETTVVWLRKPDGSWYPPVEPTLDFADGEYVMANDDGTAVRIPTIYKRHRCLSPELVQLRTREREEERQRLIAEDRVRRAEVARLAAEESELRRVQEEEKRLKQLEREYARDKSRDYDYALRAFQPKRLLPIPCRDCGAESGEPCLDLRVAELIERYEAQGRHEKTLKMKWGWRNRTAHNARFEDGPPAAPPKRIERWGEDYKGPWPPRPEDPGRHEMRNWLANNFRIFDSDGYLDRDWLMPVELITMTQWLRKHAEILTREEEGDGNGPGEVVALDRSAGAEGAGEPEGAARGPEAEGDRIHPQ